VHQQLDRIIGQGSKLKILRFLYLRNGEHTGRAIAREIGMSPSVVSNSLKELREEGVISLRTAGKTHLYGIIEDSHLVRKLLAPLFEEEKSINENIISTIVRGLSGSKNEIISLALFGSFARQEETSRSDIDLLVITRDKKGKAVAEESLDKIDQIVMKKFRTCISPYIKTKTEFIKAYQSEKPLIKSILLNHRLLSGEPLERILG